MRLKPDSMVSREESMKQIYTKLCILHADEIYTKLCILHADEIYTKLCILHADEIYTKLCILHADAGEDLPCVSRLLDLFLH